MNWFPVLSACAIVAAAYLGIDNPGRTIIVQVGIAACTLVGMAVAWWKESRLATRTI